MMGHPRNRAERRTQRDRVVANRMRLIYFVEQPRQWDNFRQYCYVDGVYNRKVGNRGRWFRYPGRFHKRKPYDCGNSKCRCCHLEKVYFPKTKRLVAKKELREYLDSLRNSEEI